MEYSQQLLERFEHPRFSSTVEERDAFLQKDRTGQFSVDIRFSKTNEMTLFGQIDKNQPESPILNMKYWASLKDERTGFLDALVQMCIGQNDQSLEQVSFKKIEGSLRDKEEVSAIPEGRVMSFVTLFVKVMGDLKKTIESSRGRQAPGQKISPTIEEDYRPLADPLFVSDKEGPFVSLAVDRQHYFINKIIEHYIRPFLYRDHGDIECLFIDGSMIVVEYKGACAQCSKSLTSTMGYIQGVFRKELSDSSILVVTDS